MKAYPVPSVRVLGSVSELTQSNIYKTTGTGDVLIISGTSESVPGSDVTSTS